MWLRRAGRLDTSIGEPAVNRRLGWKLALHGAIGVIATILTSWMCQFIPSSTYDASPLAPGEWPFTAPTDWPVKPDSALQDANLGRRTILRSHNLDQYAATRRSDPTVVMHSTVEHRYGLPMRAMRRLQGTKFRLRVTTPVNPSFTEAGLLMPRSLQNGLADRERLAIQPIPIGFACNVVFYATTSWLVIAAASRWRVSRRRRSGRCVRCGYNLTGNTDGLCPECGDLGSHRTSIPPATS